MGRFFKIFIFFRLANSFFFSAKNSFKSIVVFLVRFFVSGIVSLLVLVSSLVFFSGISIFSVWSLVFSSGVSVSSGFVVSGSARGGFLTK